jgi:signal transduction histidine kinase
VAKSIMDDAVPAALREGVWTGESELLLGPNGENIPVSQVIIAHPSRDAEHAYFSTIMRDITEHKKFEESQRFLLDASRAFSGSLEVDAVMRSIAELTVPSHADYCGVYLIGEDGTIARKIVARAARAVGNVRALPPGKQPDPVIAEVLKRGEPILLTDLTDASFKKLVSSRHLDQLRKAAHCSAMYLPLRTRQGLSGVIYVRRHEPGHKYDTHDFSLAKEFAGRAALAIDNAHLFQQSQAATRLRDEVLRVVAHDLRNPLNTISLSADLLRELPRTDPQLWEKQLEVIIRSVAYADRLIQDLLDVARVQAGKLSMERTSINPDMLLRQVIEQLQPAAAQKSSELRTHMPEHLPPINVDRHRMEQVLANIIGNAIKFSPEGSTVSISAAREGNVIRVSVEDHGPGLSASEITHLFDPFWQASKTAGGIGLGLPIA